MPPGHASLGERPTAFRVSCGVPPDSQFFDVAGVEPVAAEAGETVLARFDLQPQYCGQLEYFAQYTDRYASSGEIETDGLRWAILVNGRPTAPYEGFDLILNPWGNGSFPVQIQLPDGASVEMVVRRDGRKTSIGKAGGRLLGRYWYNPAYGDVRFPAERTQRGVRWR
jgi:hypothetical protein